ncbi:MAG: flagellin [Candidatus Sedimenticola sp. PURPLELP]
MAITVNTNIYSMAARRNVSRSQTNLMTAVQRLSSGLRINMAKDDAAGIGIAQLAESHARGAAIAQRTLGDGFSRLQIVDGALQTAAQIVQRLRELQLTKLSGTYTSAQKGYLDTEIADLNTEIGAIMGRAQYNGAAAAGSFSVLAGPGGSLITVGQAVTLTTVSSVTTATTALNTINSALAKYGAGESVLEKAMTTAMNLEEAQWAAYGRAMDADMARETARLTSAQVVQQAGVAALAQANTLPQLALGLLG